MKISLSIWFIYIRGNNIHVGFKGNYILDLHLFAKLLFLTEY